MMLMANYERGGVLQACEEEVEEARGQSRDRG
jgi:hypothetical protein